MVGSQLLIDAVTAFLGETSNDHLELDRTELTSRRIFVSSQEVAGHRLRDLPLRQRFEAVVTRVRRGDVVFSPGETRSCRRETVSAWLHRLN